MHVRIDLTEVCDRGIDRGFGLSRLGVIGSVRFDATLGPCGRARGRERFVDRGAAGPLGQREIVPVAREIDRDPAREAARGARDERPVMFAHEVPMELRRVGVSSERSRAIADRWR
jgi:hypothetical protein